MRLFLSLVAAAWLCALPAASHAQVAGDWQGTLSVNGTLLHLALHIFGAGDAMHATLDSIDQNAFGLPVNTITFSKGTLTWRADTLHASYTGKLSADGSALAGTFAQGSATLPLNFARLSSVGPAKADRPIDGTWTGSFDLPTGKLPVAFHFMSAGGKLSGTMDSPQQGASGLVFSSISRAGSTLHLALASIGATFDGSFTPDLQALTGTWTQNGASLPLTLARATAGQAESAAPKRPQTPAPPFPYRSEEVSYRNEVQGNTLAGTLTIPPGKGPFPAVLLITGSGAQDRDETLLGHKPFLVLADYLSRHGILVLRVDDRGTAKSTGDFVTATTADFATDAAAGVRFLRTRPDVDTHRLGLLGHSEGGLVADMLAATDPRIGFIVLMAGPGARGDALILEQQRLILQASGLPAEQITQSATLEKQLLDTDAMTLAPAERTARLRVLLAASRPGATEEQLTPLVNQLTSPWFLSFLRTDPATYLSKVHCPVLVLAGSLDLQVPPAQNLPAIEAALKAAGNTNVTVHEFSGLNHLFQPATTGSPSEYAGIETTIDPAVLQVIATWITGLKPH